MSKLETNTIDNVSGSSTLTIGDSNTSTITLKSGATLTNFPSNTPAFLAKPSSDQTSLSNNSDIKVLLGTEIFDTDNAFDSSRFTVPSGAAGKYFFYGQLRMQVDSDGDLDNAYIYFFKNGSLLLQTRTDFGGNNIRSHTPTNAIVADLSVGDYMELYGAIQSSSARSFIAADTRFGGYKIIE
tara:strand:- start:68 stop:616 length:549 start_codon:yes stop_codon:yes gene_type:complete